jgi:hypothetical protein
MHYSNKGQYGCTDSSEDLFSINNLQTNGVNIYIVVRSTKLRIQIKLCP